MICLLTEEAGSEASDVEAVEFDQEKNDNRYKVGLLPKLTY